MEKDIPKISVIMPVYNAQNFLKEAIISVLDQTEKDFELIIVNDGSTDASADIVRSFKDGRIQFFDRQHFGLIDSLNFGISKVRGEFIARFDADDVCAVTRFEEQLDYFTEHPECAIVGSWADVIDNFGETTGTLSYPPETWKQIKRYSLLHNPFIHSSVMVRKKIIDEVGTYNKFFRHAEDYELWTRIIYRYTSANIPEPLLKYRIHQAQVTKHNGLEMRLRGFLIRMLSLVRLCLAIAFYKN